MKRSGCVFVCTTEYTKQAIAAERRLQRGERQLHCGECDKWVWPEACDHPNRQTAQQFAALIRERRPPDAQVPRPTC